MKHSLIPILGLLCFQSNATAADDILLLRPDERRAVEAQTDQFNQAIAPALSEAAKSTVRIWSGKKRLAYGTVIGTGNRILTKWSEVASASGNIRIEGAGGVVLAAQVIGVYENDDLAVLETTGSPLTPVKWSMKNPPLGSFLAATQPDGRPAAFGVVSVLERNLRETDNAFLGVVGAMDFEGIGVKIAKVAPDSGAEAAGLQSGDIILRVGDRPISGLMELQNSLVGREPGTTATLRVRSGKSEKDVSVKLGNRPELPNFPGDRLRQMERMGGPISRVRDSFTRVIQTDMRPRPDQIGGPVVDLKGNVIGITMARADRTRSFVMPAAAIRKVLESEPSDPALAMAKIEQQAAPVAVRGRSVPRSRMVPAPQGPSEDRLREHLSEMQRLMDFMRQEMDDLQQRQ